MSIRKVVAGLLITAGIAIMAVPFFWRATGEKQTEQLISEFEQTLEDDYDEETDVEERGNTLSIISNQGTGAAKAAPFTEWRKQNGYGSRKNTYQ